MEIDLELEDGVPIPPLIVTGKLKLIPKPPGSSDPCLTHPAAEVIDLKGDHFVIGRIMASDSVINSLQISRKHCVLEYRENTWWIQDYSTNGVRVNNTPLQKLIPKKLSTNDILDLIPGGALSYKFEYTNNCVLGEEGPSELHSTANSFHDALSMEEDNIGDESESLLSIESDDLLGSESSAVTGLGLNAVNDNNNLTAQPPLTESLPQHSARTDFIAETTNQNRNTEFRQISNSTRHHCPSPNKRGFGKTSSAVPKKTSDPMESEPEDVDELLDIDDVHCVFPAPQRTVPPASEDLKTTDVLTSVVSMNADSGSSTTASNTRLKSQPNILVDLASESEPLDQQVLNRQLKYFTEQYKDLKNEHRLFALKSSIERDQLKQQMEEVKAAAEAEKSKLFQNILSALDSELNCCICNEVYINAAVIDCGHTFCHHCITEWTQKKSDCPICRTAITKSSRQVDLNNFVIKMHSLLPSEVQQRRESLLKERETEVSVAKAVQTAEAEERTNAAGGRRINRIMNAMDIDELELNLDDVGNWIGIQQLAGGVQVQPRNIPAASTRRSTRIRRVRAVNPAMANAPDNGPGVTLRATNQTATARRGSYRGGSSRGVHAIPVPAVPAPDLITLDDSQVDMDGLAAMVS